MTNEMSVWEKIEERPPFDFAVISHHFTPYMRDYDMVLEFVAAHPSGQTFYVYERCLYRFTHCVEARCTTTVSDQAWNLSWSDTFIDREKWQQAGAPNGYLWGVNWADAYPGFRFMKDSIFAKNWAERLNHPMHEILVETNAFTLILIFHDVHIIQLAKGDPTTGQLIETYSGPMA